jgi:bacterial leucyl aminopeptidase
MNFMDITDYQHLGYENAFRAASGKKPAVKFPPKPAFQDEVKPMLKELEKDNMKANLEKFTSFHTRYAKVHFIPQLSLYVARLIVA